MIKPKTFDDTLVNAILKAQAHLSVAETRPGDQKNPEIAKAKEQIAIAGRIIGEIRADLQAASERF